MKIVQITNPSAAARSLHSKSECPPFEVGDKGEGWEERTYEAGKWAVTKLTDTKYELAYTRAAAKLMRYFKGSNEDEERMELTTPTLASLKLEKDAGVSVSFRKFWGLEFLSKGFVAPCACTPSPTPPATPSSRSCR